MTENKKTTFGLDKNIANAATYLLGWVTGLIFFLVEKEDKEIRFNAAQSIIFFGALQVLMFIPIIGQLATPFLGLIGLIGWIVLLVKSYQGETFRLPVVAEYADKLVKRVNN